MITERRRRTMLLLAAPGLAWLSAYPAVAQTVQTGRTQNEGHIGACIQRAAGGRAWLEKTLWGLRDQEGGWAGAMVRNADGSHDLGPLQINSWWVGRIASITGKPAASVRYWLVNDVCFNVDAARWIFLSALAETRDYWKAVGAYHSPTGWRRRRYAVGVSLRLKRRFGPQVFASRGAASDVSD